MAVKSVSLLNYSENVAVSGSESSATNNTLVNRGYITNDLLGIPEYSKGASNGYNKGDYVQNKGLIWKALTTQESGNVADLVEGANWTQTTFPVLHKYTDSKTVSSSSGASVDSDGYATVSVTHNLNTKDISVQVYKMVSGSPVPIFAAFTFDNNNGDNTIIFKIAPDSTSVTYRFVIIAAK